MDRKFAEIAALLGEPSRAAMLWNLLDGRAYSAGELAIVADISRQAASNHLKKLVRANILKVEKQGRHRYYRFSRMEVAYAIEAIANVIPDQTMKKPQDLEIGDIQYARTCYDHLAGRVAVAMTQSMINKRIIVLRNDAFTVTSGGEKWFDSLDIDVHSLKKNKRAFARPCLDWTERKHHLAGSLGAALLERMFALDWVRKKRLSRAVILTAKGQSALYDLGK